MDYTAEVQTKLARLRELMHEQQVGAVWLRTVSNVAWITGGLDIAVNTASSTGIASVVVTEDSATVWTDSIEAPRLGKEDLIEARGFALRYAPWYGSLPIELGATLATDGPFEGAKNISRELQILRSKLLPVEIDRFRTLGGLCAESMQHAINRVKPGHSEFEIAASLSYEMYGRGVRPVVVLIATDERIFSYRHPLPTAKIMDKYAMLVLCGRKAGLTCSVTRLIHFGELPEELKHKQQACAEVDAAIIAASQPGATMEELFGVLQNAYAKVGYADQWQYHHQGGTAAYEARELLAVPGEKTPLETGMVCAWNPSITGMKCEDSILVPEAGGTPEILTPIFGWPSVTVEVNGITLERPVIMEIV